MIPTQSDAKPARAEILGVKASAINLRQALGTIMSWIAECRQRFACIAGAHGVMERQHAAALLAIHNQAGLLLGQSHSRRVYEPALMRASSQLSARRGSRQSTAR